MSMEEGIESQQMEKALKLCDMLGIQDFTVGVQILNQYNWNIEKAMEQIAFGTTDKPNQSQQKKQIKLVHQKSGEKEDYGTYNYDVEQNQDNANQMDFEYQYNQLEQKKEMFEQQYLSLPLIKTTSLGNSNTQKKLQKDCILSKQFTNHRRQYDLNILSNSERLYNEILCRFPKQKRKLYESKRRIELNRNFISFLYEHYKPLIHFTFGTFLLNLMRSYLSSKFLLVYVHQNQQSANKTILNLLRHREIANFINKHCITYGMFDNSDDYEIVQKYLPLKQLPAFLLFKFDVKRQAQNFRSSYSIVQRQDSNLLEWLAQEIGVSIKKKPIIKEIIEQQVQGQNLRLSVILNQQNLQYERMQNIAKMKKQEAKIEQIKIESKESLLKEIRQKFTKEPIFESEKTIKIKFRMPVTGKCIERVFNNVETVQIIFDFIDCFGREEFQNTYGDFDLTQTFPFISLKEHREKPIKDVFPGSDHQNIIVKEQ